MHHAGKCPRCEQGLLGLRVCAGGAHVVLMCDECDAVWTTPDTKQRPLYLDQPRLPCPTCRQPLRDEPAHWAEATEIEQHGWSDAVQGAYERRSVTTKSPSRGGRKRTTRRAGRKGK
jgi:hypothetical protein